MNKTDYKLSKKSQKPQDYTSTLSYNSNGQAIGYSGLDFPSQKNRNFLTAIRNNGIDRNLRKIIISVTNFDEDFCRFFITLNFDNLKSLCLTDGQMTDRCLAIILSRPYPKLKKLWIGSNNLTGHSFQLLKNTQNLPALRFLELNGVTATQQQYSLLGQVSFPLCELVIDNLNGQAVQQIRNGLPHIIFTDSSSIKTEDQQDDYIVN